MDTTKLKRNLKLNESFLKALYTELKHTGKKPYIMSSIKRFKEEIYLLKMKISLEKLK